MKEIMMSDGARVNARHLALYCTCPQGKRVQSRCKHIMHVTLTEEDDLTDPQTTAEIHVVVHYIGYAQLRLEIPLDEHWKPFAEFLLRPDKDFDINGLYTVSTCWPFRNYSHKDIGYIHEKNCRLDLVRLAMPFQLDIIGRSLLCNEPFCTVKRELYSHFNSGDMTTNWQNTYALWAQYLHEHGGLCPLHNVKAGANVTSSI